MVSSIFAGIAFCDRWIDLQSRIIEGMSTTLAMAIGTRNQSVHGIVKQSQSGLEIPAQRSILDSQVSAACIGN